MPDLTQEEAMMRGLDPSLRGKAAMWVDCAEVLVYLFPRPGVAPLPGGSPIIVSGYFISSGTSHPQEAWKWIRFLSEHIPPPSKLPARRELIWGSTYAQEVGEEALEVLLYAVEHALPPIRPGALMGLVVEEALESIFDGERVEEALTKAQEEAMAKIAKGLEEVIPEPIVVATPRPEAEVIITFWTMPDGYKSLAREFREAHPDIEVEVAWLFGFPRDPGSVVKATRGDCFLLRSGSLLDEDARGALLNLQPFIDTDPAFPLEDYYPQALEEMRYEGQLWGLPAPGMIFGLLYYNKSLFDEMGLSYPDADWTWEDFFEKAKKLSKGEGAEKRWGLGVRKDGFDLLFLLEAMSGGLVDDFSSPRAFRFHSPEAIEAARILAELSQADAIMGAEGWEDLTRNERVGMWTGYFYLSPEHAKRIDLGIALLPKGRRGIAIKTFDAYYISADTPYPEACWEWIKFLSNRITEGKVPPRRSLVESEAFREKVGEDIQAVYLEALEYDDSNLSKGLEGLPGSQRAYRFLKDVLEEIVWKGADVHQALAEAQRKADTYVDCLRRSDDPEAAAEACFREAGGE
jgi:multiple sugar transport system substrate-binding protein